MSGLLLSHPGSLYEALFPEARPRIIAAVGGGGKTTFLNTLAAELHDRGRRVVVTTTTKTRPPEDPALLAQTVPEAAQLLDAGHIPLAGQYLTKEKVQGLPGSLPVLAAMADYVLIEADGSRKRPLKMTDPAYEPVIPPEAEAVVALAGLDALGCPVSQVVHRPELACKALGVSPEAPVTPELAARLLALCYRPRYVLLNKADGPDRQRAGLAVAAHLPGARCVIASLRDWGHAELR